MADEIQGSLFTEDELPPEKWQEDWKGMPEFKQADLTSFNQIIVHFETRADMDAFSKLIGQTLTYKTRSIWFPEAEIGRMSNKRFIDMEGGSENES